MNKIDFRKLMQKAFTASGGTITNAVKKYNYEYHNKSEYLRCLFCGAVIFYEYQRKEKITEKKCDKCYGKGGLIKI